MTTPLNRYQRNRVQLETPEGEGRTLQSQTASCDINKIVALHKKTGQITHFNTSTPRYGDFSNVDDYLGALNQVSDAQAAFQALPSALRARFENDPAQLIAFFDNPDNTAEAIELGLIPGPDADINPIPDPTPEVPE